MRTFTLILSFTKNCLNSAFQRESQRFFCRVRNPSLQPRLKNWQSVVLEFARAYEPLFALPARLTSHSKQAFKYLTVKKISYFLNYLTHQTLFCPLFIMIHTRKHKFVNIMELYFSFIKRNLIDCFKFSRRFAINLHWAVLGRITGTREEITYLSHLY